MSGYQRRRETRHILHQQARRNVHKRNPIATRPDTNLTIDPRLPSHRHPHPPPPRLLALHRRQPNQRNTPGRQTIRQHRGHPLRDLILAVHDLVDTHPDRALAGGAEEPRHPRDDLTDSTVGVHQRTVSTATDTPRVPRVARDNLNATCDAGPVTEDFRTSQAAPGPADTEYTTAGLAWVAFAQAAVDLAKQSAALIQDNTRGSKTQDCTWIVDAAQKLLKRAMVYDYEHKRPIRRGYTIPLDNIADDPEVQDAIDEWYDAVERPWSDSGYGVASRLPKGLTDPLAAARELDKWCAEHIKPSMYPTVTGQLTAHNPTTAAASAARHRAFLAAQGENISPQEHNAQLGRERRLQDAQQARLPDFAQIEHLPPEDDPRHLIHTFWPQIVENTSRRHPTLAEFIAGARCVRAAGLAAFIGHPELTKARVLNAITATFADAVFETIGWINVQIYVVDPDTEELIVTQDRERQEAEGAKKHDPDDLGF